MSYVPYVDTYAQAEEGNANNQSGNELAANQHLNIMTSQFEQGQESNQFTDSFTNNSNMTLPQFDQEQGNSSFVDGINVNTPSSRKRVRNLSIFLKILLTILANQSNSKSSKAFSF